MHRIYSIFTANYSTLQFYARGLAFNIPLTQRTFAHNTISLQMFLRRTLFYISNSEEHVIVVFPVQRVSFTETAMALPSRPSHEKCHPRDCFGSTQFFLSRRTCNCTESVCPLVNARQWQLSPGRTIVYAR